MSYDRIKDREETKAERLDRQLLELLNEVRVAVPGVQVLFAFLLTVPFSSRWGDTTDLQHDVYFATLLMTAIATAFLMAPSSIHRVLFERGDKEFIVRAAHWLLLAGLAALALAVSGARLPGERRPLRRHRRRHRGGLHLRVHGGAVVRGAA